MTPRQALTAAVNRSLANGAPVLVNQPARVVEVRRRPVCENASSRRCRRTAVASVDGTWLCADHAAKARGNAVPIVRKAGVA